MVFNFTLKVTHLCIWVKNKQPFKLNYIQNYTHFYTHFYNTHFYTFL